MNDHEFQESLREYIVSTLKELGEDPYKEAVYAGTKAFTKVFLFKRGMNQNKVSGEAMAMVYNLVYNALQDIIPEIEDLFVQGGDKMIYEEEKD